MMLDLTRVKVKYLHSARGHKFRWRAEKAYYYYYYYYGAREICI